MLQLQPDSLARSVSRGPGICHLFPPRQRAEGNEIVKICDSSATSDGAPSALECLRVPPGFQLWVSGGPCSLLPTANMPHLCRMCQSREERRQSPRMSHSQVSGWHVRKTSKAGRALVTEQFRSDQSVKRLLCPLATITHGDWGGGAFSEPWTVACSREQLSGLVNYRRAFTNEVDSAGAARQTCQLTAANAQRSEPRLQIGKNPKIMTESGRCQFALTVEQKAQNT